MFTSLAGYQSAASLDLSRCRSAMSRYESDGGECARKEGSGVWINIPRKESLEGFLQTSVRPALVNDRIHGFDREIKSSRRRKSS